MFQHWQEHMKRSRMEIEGKRKKEGTRSLWDLMFYLFTCFPNSLSQSNCSSRDKTTFYNCPLSFSHFLSWKLTAKRSCTAVLSNAVIFKTSKNNYYLLLKSAVLKLLTPFSWSWLFSQRGLEEIKMLFECWFSLQVKFHPFMIRLITSYID